MKTSEFTPKEFLNICDQINMISSDCVDVYISGPLVCINKLFTSKREAKEEVYKLVGYQLDGINIGNIQF